MKETEAAAAAQCSVLREASVFQFAAAHSPLCCAVKWKTFMMQMQAGVINLCFADVEEARSPSPSISLPYPPPPLPLSISLSLPISLSLSLCFTHLLILRFLLFFFVLLHHATPTLAP